MQDEDNLPDKHKFTDDDSIDSASSEFSENNDKEESVSQLKSSLEEAYLKHETLNAKYLRVCADLDNLRKRSIRDREDAIQRTRTQIIEDLLPVIDAFRIGLNEAIKTDPDGPVAQGFKMAFDQLDLALNEYGLSCIEALGEPFDPMLHEAIGYEPSEKDGIILKTIRVGYKLKNVLLRPATVIVSQCDNTESSN